MSSTRAVLSPTAIIQELAEVSRQSLNDGRKVQKSLEILGNSLGVSATLLALHHKTGFHMVGQWMIPVNAAWNAQCPVWEHLWENLEEGKVSLAEFHGLPQFASRPDPLVNCFGG